MASFTSDESKQHKSGLLQRGYKRLQADRSSRASGSSRHVLLRVGMAGKDGEGAVKLFGEHGSGKFVRERQGR